MSGLGMAAKGKKRMALSSRPTFGLLIPYTTTPWAERQWLGMARASRDLDVNLISYIGGVLKSSRYDEQANLLYDLALGKELDGLVVWSTAIGWNTTRREMADFLGRFSRIPMVSLEMEFPGIPSVVMDDSQGMGLVVSHLIEEHGCRRIAFLRGVKTHEGAERRYRAYLGALEEHGLPFDPSLVPDPNDSWDGIEAMKALLDGTGADFDAVVAVNDFMMLQVIPLLKARGIRVPADAAIASFDNLPEGASITPPLTTAAPPFLEMGRRSLELLLARLSGLEVPERECMPIPLIVRESCGCLPRLLRDLGAPDPLYAEGEASAGPAESQGRVWAAFEADARDGRRETFLPALHERLNRCVEDGEEAFAWLESLAELRRSASPWLEGLSPEARRRADARWSRGQALVTEAARRQIALDTLRSNSRQAAIRSISELFSATFDTEALIAIAARELPRLGIPSCFLSLYEDRDRPDGDARLILAYDEKGEYRLPPGGLVFPAPQLAPPQYWEDDRRATHLVLALYFQSERIGFAVFKLREDTDTSLCKTLRWQFSSALKGSSLMQRERAVAREKETLLRELQHRVKNSLAVISSIIGIESRAAEGPYTREILDRIGSRISALGALYDALYDTGGIERIDLALYLGRVVDSAAESLGSDARGIAFERSLGHCAIDLKRAGYLGLIVNELVTDCLKHAFPDGRRGRVGVRFERAGGNFILEVSDDGIGLPAGFDPERDKGFGLNLVALLARQLDGDVAFESCGGTKVTVTFAE